MEPISKLPDVDKLIRAKVMRDQSYFADQEWMEEAQRACAFKAGHQWSELEKEQLLIQGREPMVWNYVHATVELLVGVLTQNPIMIKINPVEKTDGFLADVMESLADWVEENQTESEPLDTEAFEDSVTTGKGFRSIDIQPRPENPTEVLFVEECVPFWQVRIDPGSRKHDLSDARYVITEKWVSLEDFQIRYPKHAGEIEDIFNGGAERLSSYSYLDSTIVNTFDDYTTGHIDYYDIERNRVLVCQLEYFEMYNRYYWINPQNPAEAKEVAPKQAQLFPENEIIKVPAKKVKWLHFTNDFILYDNDSPIFPDGFSTVPIFAYADKSKRVTQYYGIVKPMIDPQRECNKRWLQAIKIMAHQGAGLVGEADAFVDLDQAQETWTDPEQITLLNPGGLSKIQEKTAVQFPAASIQMQEISKDSMKQITGINPDMMGIREKEEPGIVIKLRQQQGMTIISKLFRNYKRMKKQLYKIKVHLISKYMPDWQIAKILGETDKFVVKDGMVIDKENNTVAPIRAIRDMKYNLKYEDAPGNMTKTMSELAIFMDMVSKGFPVDPITIVNKLDISESAKSRWKKYIEAGQKAQQQAAQDQRSIQTAMAQADLQIKGSKAQELSLKEQKLKLDQTKVMLDAKIKRQANIIKYRELEQKEKESQRDWVLSLSQDERANLDYDLRLLGIVNQQI